MRCLRSSAITISAACWFAVAANAATYSMTGKAAMGAGLFVDLPLVGFASCPSIVGDVGFATMAPMPTTGMLIGPVPHNPRGCVHGGPAMVSVNSTGGFSIPTKFFYQSFPKYLRLSPVPSNPMILQLATGLKASGPQMSPHSKRNPVIKSAPYAPWRLMKHHTPLGFGTQTGRAGGNFTACAGSVMNLACAAPSGGFIPAIIKNFAGPGGFGGTMGLVLSTSPGLISSLMVKVGTMSIAVNPIMGVASRAAGRGYAAFNTDVLLKGPIYAMYMLTPMTPKYAVVSTVMTFVGVAVAPKNFNWGFPFTTGTIVVRGTGVTSGMVPAGQSLTAMGFDKITKLVPGVSGPTPMGLKFAPVPVVSPGGMANGRVIQLVAGHLSQSTVQGLNATPNYTIVRLPEPGRTMQRLAGVALLAAVALWRARRTR